MRGGPPRCRVSTQANTCEAGSRRGGAYSWPPANAPTNRVSVRGRTAVGYARWEIPWKVPFVSQVLITCACGHGFLLLAYNALYTKLAKRSAFAFSFREVKYSSVDATRSISNATSRIGSCSASATSSVSISWMQWYRGSVTL